MQLQHAGDIKDLRVNGTLEALDVLEAKKLISAIDAIQLRKAWTLCTAARNGSYLWSGRVNQADILPMIRTHSEALRSIWATTRTAVSISKTICLP